MSITTYYKRYRMEVPLSRLAPVPELPEAFVWVPWEEQWLEAHAEVKCRSFQGEIDAWVFPNLSNAEGCRHLMQAICGKPNFCPLATWLVCGPDGFCGTIQGLHDAEVGSIQNLGVVPECRGCGVGTALLLQALHSFRALGLRYAALEVTAKNTLAVRLYHRLGFNTVKTLYREAYVPTEEELFII
jgi:ribosomal protein S18 acetylase RimI-like enzyme